MSFASLKKQSKLGYTDRLVKEVEKMNSTSSGGADDRFWKPEMDKTGVGSAVIRFLPSPDGEELPWAKIYSHAFKGPGGWYIENSLTTNNNGKDPVSEYNRELWNSGNDKDKETVRRQKRNLSYYSNIYVVKDPANPDNEGKVFLYKFGKKIFDKILTAVKPEFDDETPVNVFDFWTGANFRLKIKKVDGYWNYDKSEFDAPSPLLDDDDALEAVWNKQYSLAALVAPDQFKSYEVLEKRLKTVLNTNISSRPLDEEVSDEDNSRGSFKPDFSARKEPVAAVASTKEEDDALSYFQRLAEDN